MLSVQAWVRVLCQLQCLRGEPVARRGIDHAPKGIEVILHVARDTPRIVSGVVPSTGTARNIATAIGFTRDFHPKVGIEKGNPGIGGRGQARASGNDAAGCGWAALGRNGNESLGRHLVADADTTIRAWGTGVARSELTSPRGK